MDGEMAKIRQALRFADIKLSTKFGGVGVTHVVATKRNLPMVLEGLIAGCFIVTDEYINDLAKASTRINGSQKAPLEVDFDAHWPDPTRYVPPPSKEPIPRPDEYFAPNKERVNLFSNFTFIFCSQNQMENLGNPINRGGERLFS